jgi:hypothetical protein
MLELSEFWLYSMRCVVPEIVKVSTALKPMEPYTQYAKRKYRDSAYSEWPPRTQVL